MDYLVGSRRTAPLIIPGQAVQEVWNNALTGVKTKSKKLTEAHKSLVREIRELDRDLGPYAEDAATSLESFAKWHGDWFDVEAQQYFIGTVKNLTDRAVSMSVPRVEFSSLAQIRNNTKTPPGFSDPSDNHGDFFIWADFMYALAVSDLSNVDGIIFVTEDGKQDWRLAGVGHPILTAEIRSLTGLPFKLCDLGELFSLAQKSIGGRSER
ncbi:MAG: PIN-like domain-containing protein [Gordonia sp. (in: high G+C Gram-positive bacteria)]|uniref:PIN-like domain-containing protein n=1 Tax=Gordonia sp. (in: high G+C Gram-positive bacteria) TaxID=84139 RepID=UPI0039E5A377